MKEVTGRLEWWNKQQVTKEYFILWGRIYEDTHGRFSNGRYIYTSDIKNRDCKEGDIVQTRNSTYLLGEEADIDDNV